MNIAFLVVVIFCSSLQSTLKKSYSLKMNGMGMYLFNALMSLVAAMFFLFSSKNGMTFVAEIIPYSIGFGLSFAVAAVFSMLAISNGPLSITALITSYSLMLPTLYGLLFLGETAGWKLYFGIALLLFSLFLIHFERGEKKMSLKWMIFVVLAFVGNGMCSTIQKMQQIAFDSAHKNEFMLIALITVSIIMAVFAVVRERDLFKTYIKSGCILAALCGVMNGVVNLLVMLLNERISASVMFPLVSAGGIVVTSFMSIFLYKEQLSKKQLTGIAVGISSVIFLSI